jgi:hypothetical protein
VHAQTIAQEHLTLSALMQDYEETFCSIIDDMPSAAHSQFFARSVVQEAPDCCIAEARVLGRQYLCAMLLSVAAASEEEGGSSAIASSFWSTLLTRPCNVVIAVGPCVLPADVGACELRLGSVEGGLLQIASVDTIGPGLRRYTLVSTENADRKIRLCWFSEWEPGSIPSNNNAWLKFWSVLSELLAAEEGDGDSGYVCVCEVAEQLAASGESSSQLLTRTSCLAIVDAVVRQATKAAEAVTEVNVARAYLDVSKTVRTGVTQAQYKFIYKAIRQAVKAKA